MKRINLRNVGGEREGSGHYRIFCRDGRLLYSGSSGNVRNRLNALRYGRADYATVANKKALRRKAVYYRVDYMPLKKARKKDRNTYSSYSVYDGRQKNKRR
jgi:hypothetical protein